MTKQEKIDFIRHLRGQRMSYDIIGLTLGISRQRVHQLFKNYIVLSAGLKRKILKRDSFLCRMSLKNICDGEKLEIHHIDGNRLNNNPRNLMTLCRKCHWKIENDLWRTKQKEKELPFIRRQSLKEPRLCKYCGTEFWVSEWEKKSYCGSMCSNRYLRKGKTKVYKEIVRLRKQGKTLKELSEKFDLTIGRISQISLGLVHSKGGKYCKKDENVLYLESKSRKPK